MAGSSFDGSDKERLLDMREYDQTFDQFVFARSPEAGVPDVVAFADTLRPGARVLDLGCGTGVPISRCLIARGCEVFGVDSSTKMIAAFRANFPNAPAQCARLQDSDFFATTFDAAVSWGVMFHLSPDDQAAVIAKVAKVLVPGGRFFFTSADCEGTAENQSHGVDFRYISLGATRYARLLTESGLTIVDEHFDRWDNYVYIAEKRSAPSEPGVPGVPG